MPSAIKDFENIYFIQKVLKINAAQKIDGTNLNTEALYKLAKRKKNDVALQNANFKFYKNNSAKFIFYKRLKMAFKLLR